MTSAVPHLLPVFILCFVSIAENNIRFEAATAMRGQPGDHASSHGAPKDGLVANYHNRNLSSSQVMGVKIPPTEQHQLGLYKASMN